MALKPALKTNSCSDHLSVFSVSAPNLSDPQSEKPKPSSHPAPTQQSASQVHFYSLSLGLILNPPHQPHHPKRGQGPEDPDPPDIPLVPFLTGSSLPPIPGCCSYAVRCKTTSTPSYECISGLRTSSLSFLAFSLCFLALSLHSLQTQYLLPPRDALQGHW